MSGFTAHCCSLAGQAWQPLLWIGAARHHLDSMSHDILYRISSFGQVYVSFAVLRYAIWSFLTMICGDAPLSGETMTCTRPLM